MERLRDEIASAVQGDLDSFQFIQNVSHHDLLKAVECGQHLVVSRRAIIRVLTELRDSLRTDCEVNRWAIFVRHGILNAKRMEVVQPINISYDAAYEDPIVEIISRLTELGDQVDGLIDGLEIDLMLNSLSEG